MNVEHKPAKSIGGIFMIIFTIIITSVLIIPMIFISQEPDAEFANIMFIVLLGVMAGIFGYCILNFYRLKYIIESECIRIRWGFSDLIIPYSTIQKVGIPSSQRFDGIKSGGIGAPGYLAGYFKILLDGEFKSVKLYATSLKKAIFIKDMNSKIYGITPEDPTAFMISLKESYNTYRSKQNGVNILIEESFDVETLRRPKEEAQKNYTRFIKIPAIIAIVLIIIPIIMIISIYGTLPGTIPVHFDINGTPDGFGPKTMIWNIVIIYSIMVGAMDLFCYLVIKIKSQLSKTKYGLYLMLLPLGMSILFCIIEVLILNMTLGAI
jgi:hypothetical protein